jgi:hypothetical protein
MQVSKLAPAVLATLVLAVGGASTFAAPVAVGRPAGRRTSPMAVAKQLVEHFFLTPRLSVFIRSGNRWQLVAHANFGV